MIEFHLPGIPPSANNAYFNLPKGGRTLTTEGKRYKRETAAYLAREYPKELMFFEPNVGYGLAVRFEMNILNKGWPDKAESRYKKADVSNRLKLLEDVLSSVAATDDSQHLTVYLSKRQSDTEFTHIWIWRDDDRAAALRALSALQ
jgi:Holliday junction resolvase RusA-like endonuclease